MNFMTRVDFVRKLRIEKLARIIEGMTCVTCLYLVDKNLKTLPPLHRL